MNKNGISIDDLPRKYAAVLYNLEFSSLKKTALSAGNYIITGFKAPKIPLTDMKNKVPEILWRFLYPLTLVPTP